MNNALSLQNPQTVLVNMAYLRDMILAANIIEHPFSVELKAKNLRKRS